MDSAPIKRSIAPDISLRNQTREAMEETQLSLLRNELPDPSIELANQHQCPSKIFTLFPELPPEIRVAVWKWMIPRRTLDLGCLAYCYGSTRRHCPSLRVAEVLHVDKESRLETTKYYNIVWEHKEITLEQFWSSNEYQKRTKSAGCFFFSPVFDTLSIRYRDMGWMYTIFRREVLKRIDYFRIIELPIFWSEYSHDFSQVHLRDFEWLLQFSQLEEIYMGWRWDPAIKSEGRRRLISNYKCNKINEDKLLHWTEDLKEFLHKHAEVFPKGKPPKVAIGKVPVGYYGHVCKSVISGCTNGENSLLRSKLNTLPICTLKVCNLVKN